MAGSRIVIDVPDPASAGTLSHSLAARFRVSFAQLPSGRCQVEVDTEHAPYEAVVDLLNEVERWLDAEGLDEARLQLDGRGYTMLRDGRVEPVVRATAR